MKKTLLLTLILFSLKGISQEANFFNLKGKELHNNIRLNYTLVNQPTDKVGYNLQPTMGFVGLNYNIPLTDWLYTGAGFHTAITGDQGGLFTLGVNLGVNFPLFKKLYFDANIHFGGGGGYRSLVNGGGIVYPNAGLQYKTATYSFGIQYGYVNFFTGIQKSDNVSFFFEIPTTLRSTSYANAQKSFTVNNTNKDAFWQKPAVKSVQQVTFDYFFPFGNSRTDASTTPRYQQIDNTLSILGFEYQKYITHNTFIYAQVDAMYGGLTAGFMDLFFGVGKNFLETTYVNFFAKMGIGAAGGRIYPEGGLTMYPNAGLDFKITEKFGLSVHGGYHRSIGGIASFQAYTAGFSLKYYGLSGGITTPFSNQKINTITTRGIQVMVQNQTYFDVAKFGIPNSDLQLIGIKLAYDINKRIYLAGEASFAYEGESGGYAHGLFGFGMKSTPFFKEKVTTFVELSAGVSGGGRVDSGEGVLLRPTLGLNYLVNKELSFHVSGGQMWSPFGNVNSANLTIGLAYGLSILNAKK